MFMNTIQYELIEVFKNYGSSTALVYKGKEILYSELDKRSNYIANFLLSKKYKKGTFIGVMTEDRAALITLILGILKAGCVFVPLDVAYPMKKLENMIGASDTEIVFADLKNKNLITDNIQNQKVEILIIEDTISGQADEIQGEIEYGPDDPIYIYFTSGSTGKPKAIIGRNKGLWQFVKWEITTLNIDSGFRVSQFTSPCHDPFLRDIFTPFCSGATVCIPDNKEVILETKSIIEWIEKSKINVIHCTPSLFKVFNSNGINKESFKDLKYILLAGEKINPKDLYVWYDIIGDRVQLVNMYGPTETTLAKLYYLIKSSDINNSSIPLGKPIKGARAIILDKEMQLCPKGTIGEIYIRTPYRSLGYYNNPEMNREKFVQNRFNNDPDDLLYKTGDLGKILEDENFEFIGRIDRQIKIRGFRVELDEIENALLSHINVKEAAVIDKETDTGEKYLCAYILTSDLEDNKIDISEYKQYLAERVSDYMIPKYITKLEKMPVTQNGKLDYAALPQPDKLSDNESVLLPRDKIEMELAEIWTEILGVEGIGIDKKFLQIGGHSLNAMTLIAKVYQHFQVEISLDNIFNNGTIEELAKCIRDSVDIKYLSIQAVEKREYYPVSSAQRRIFILNKLNENDISYNIPQTLIVEGEIDQDRIAETYQKLIQRHEAFRTCFEIVDGEPVQRILPEVEFNLEILDASDKDIDGLVENFVRPFDLGKAPLMRVGLAQLEKNKYVIVMDIHHIISDGTSQGIIVKDFLDLYKGINIPELSIQYKDFAIWQNDLLSSEWIQAQEKCWLEMLSGELPKLNLNGDFQRPRVQSYEGNRVFSEICSEYTTDFKTLVNSNNATLFMGLSAIYNILLWKYTGQEDIIVGTPIAGRRHEDLRNIVGSFVNTLALRSKPSGVKTFKEFLYDMKRTALKAFENQDFQFNMLVDKLGLERDLSRNPVFDTMFILQNMELPEIMVENLKITPFVHAGNVSKMDLTLEAAENSGKINFHIEYASQLFRKETIERMVGHYINILHQVIENPDIKLSDIEIVTESERKKILVDFNNTELEYPKNKTIHQLIDEQAALMPDNTALIFEDISITYRELSEKSNSLARVLKSNGLKKDGIIGLMTSRSIEMVIGILGILKSGGAYLPIDPDYPQQRIEYMLKDSRADIMLTEQALIDKVAFDGVSINLNDSSLYCENTSPLGNTNSAQDLAYVIYTSGSTGTPKGVMIEHRALVNFAYGMCQRINFEQNKVILSLTTVSFDIFGLEIFVPLIKGMQIVIANQRQQIDPEEMKKVIEAEKVDMIQMTPSRLQLLMSGNNTCSCLKNLKEIMVGGEAFPKNLLDSLEGHTNARILNMFGPTETTIWSSIKDLSFEKDITIGTPIANTQMYILDNNFMLQPIGVIGELYIAGDGLSRGYFDREELTNERFVDNPFRTVEKMYRTGDIARWLPNGEIEFIGRVDHQVKIRGYRIELNEIQTYLSKHPTVKESIVIDRTDKFGNKYLCAYIVAEDDIPVQEIKQHLTTSLPEYMIPSYFIRLEEFPHTPNGKIDRKALPEYDTMTCLREAYLEPVGEVEKKLSNIWKELLGVDKVGSNDNFFDCGGNSLLVILMQSRIEEVYPDKIKVADIFSYPTLSKLAELIGQGTDSDVLMGNLELPQQYLAEKTKAESSTVYKFSVQDSTYMKVKEISENESFAVADVIIAAGVYTLYGISENTEITIQATAEENEKFYPIKLDFTKIESFRDLIGETGRVRQAQHNLYSKQDAANANIKRESGKIIPLFCDYNMQDNGESILRIFDIVFKISLDEDKAIVSCDYDSKRLKRDGVKDIVSKYASALKLIAENYDGLN